MVSYLLFVINFNLQRAKLKEFFCGCVCVSLLCANETARWKINSMPAATHYECLIGILSYFIHFYRDFAFLTFDFAKEIKSKRAVIEAWRFGPSTHSQHSTSSWAVCCWFSGFVWIRSNLCAFLGWLRARQQHSHDLKKTIGERGFMHDLLPRRFSVERCDKNETSSSEHCSKTHGGLSKHFV